MFKVVTEESEWRRSIDMMGEHDFYHTWDFHRISERNGEGKPLLFLYNKEECTIAWPLLLRSFQVGGREWKDFTSSYGYPGPLLKGHMTADDGGGLGGENDSFLYFKSGFSRMKLPFNVANIVVDAKPYEFLERMTFELAERLGLSVDGDFFPCYRGTAGNPLHNTLLHDIPVV